MEFVLPLPQDMVKMAPLTATSWRNLCHRLTFFHKLEPCDLDLEHSRSESVLAFLGAESFVDSVMNSVSCHKTVNMATRLLLGTVSDICLPRFILLYERFKFFSSKQKPGECICRFLYRLLHLSELCEFESSTETHISNRIVQGTTEPLLQDKLLNSRIRDLHAIVDICFRSTKCQNGCCCIDFKSYADIFLQMKHTSKKNPLTQDTIISMKATSSPEALTRDSIISMKATSSPEALTRDSIISMKATSSPEALTRDSIISMKATSSPEALTLTGDSIISMKAISSPEALTRDSIISMKATSSPVALTLTESCPTLNHRKSTRIEQNILINLSLPDVSSHIQAELTDSKKTEKAMAKQAPLNLWQFENPVMKKLNTISCLALPNLTINSWKYKDREGKIVPVVVKQECECETFTKRKSDNVLQIVSGDSRNNQNLTQRCKEFSGDIVDKSDVSGVNYGVGFIMDKVDTVPDTIHATDFPRADSPNFPENKVCSFAEVDTDVKSTVKRGISKLTFAETPGQLFQRGLRDGPNLDFSDEDNHDECIILPEKHSSPVTVSDSGDDGGDEETDQLPSEMCDSASKNILLIPEKESYVFSKSFFDNYTTWPCTGILRSSFQSELGDSNPTISQLLTNRYSYNTLDSQVNNKEGVNVSDDSVKTEVTRNNQVDKWDHFSNSSDDPALTGSCSAIFSHLHDRKPGAKLSYVTSTAQIKLDNDLPCITSTNQITKCTIQNVDHVSDRQLDCGNTGMYEIHGPVENVPSTDTNCRIFSQDISSCCYCQRKRNAVDAFHTKSKITTLSRYGKPVSLFPGFAKETDILQQTKKQRLMAKVACSNTTEKLTAISVKRPLGGRISVLSLSQSVP